MIIKIQCGLGVLRVVDFNCIVMFSFARSFEAFVANVKVFDLFFKATAATIEMAFASAVAADLGIYVLKKI